MCVVVMVNVNKMLLHKVTGWWGGFLSQPNLNLKLLLLCLEIEDKIERQKAQVTSTLDRLMRRVAAEKRERAEKCRAFKVKLALYQAGCC